MQANFNHSNNYQLFQNNLLILKKFSKVNLNKFILMANFGIRLEYRRFVTCLIPKIRYFHFSKVV